MKLKTFAIAIKSLQCLYAEPLDLSVSYQLNKRLPEIEKCLNLFNHEKEKIMKLYEGEERESKFQELLEFETEFNYLPLKVKVREGITLSANDIKSLEPFVIFEEV